MKKEKLMIPEEVAELLNIEKETVYEYARKGIIPSVIIGDVIRFSPRWIQSFIDNGSVDIRVGMIH